MNVTDEELAGTAKKAGFSGEFKVSARNGTLIDETIHFLTEQVVLRKIFSKPFFRCSKRKETANTEFRSTPETPIGSIAKTTPDERRRTFSPVVEAMIVCCIESRDISGRKLVFICKTNEYLRHWIVQKRNLGSCREMDGAPLTPVWKSMGKTGLGGDRVPTRVPGIVIIGQPSVLLQRSRVSVIAEDV